MFINEIIYRLDYNFIGLMNRTIDKYLMIPGKNLSEFMENEVKNNSFMKPELLNNSIIKTCFLKLNYGEEIFQYFKGKCTIIYHMIFRILNGFEYKNYIEWKMEKEKLIIDFKIQWKNHNNDFYKFINFNQDSIDDNIKEQDEIYKYMDKLNAGYHFKLENIIFIEENLIFNNFDIAIDYFLNNKSTYFDLTIERKFKHYSINDSIFTKEQEPILEQNDFLKIYDQKEYYINIQMELETRRFEFKKKYHKFINLILLPFIFSFHYYKEGIKQDKPYEKNSPFSPYATKSLIRLQYEMKENEERKLLSFMIFFIERNFQMNQLHLLIIDHIEESTEKKTILIDPSLKIYDQRNLMTFFILKEYHKSLFYNSGYLFELSYLDNSTDPQNDLDPNLLKSQKRDKELKDSISTKYDSRENTPTLLFYIVSQFHTITDKILSNLDIGDEKSLINEMNSTNKIIIEFFKNTFPNIFNKYEFKDDYMKQLQHEDLLKPIKFDIYKHNNFYSMNDIIFKRSLFFLQLIFFLTINCNIDKKLYHYSIRNKLSDYWIKYQRFIQLGFNPFLMNLILNDKLELSKKQSNIPITKNK